MAIVMNHFSDGGLERAIFAQSVEDDKRVDQIQVKTTLECSICMESLGKIGVKALQCMHCFHQKCIDLATKIKPECPICRTSTLNSIQATFPHIDLTFDAEREEKEQEQWDPSILSGGVSVLFRSHPIIPAVFIPIQDEVHHAHPSFSPPHSPHRSSSIEHVAQRSSRRVRRVLRRKPYQRHQVPNDGCDAFIAQGPHVGDVCGRRVKEGTTKCGLHRNA
jgi:hypothetical protein